MVARRTLRRMGIADGAGAARAYHALNGKMDSDVTAGAVRDEELLHDAGIDTGLPFPVKVAIAAVGVAMLLTLVLVALLF